MQISKISGRKGTNHESDESTRIVLVQISKISGRKGTNHESDESTRIAIVQISKISGRKGTNHESDESTRIILVSQKKMIYYKEETYMIIGAAMHVYNVLGHGFLEAVYQEALEIELEKRGIPSNPQRELIIYYDGKPLKKTYIPDVICYDRIIVELKAVLSLDDGNRAQVHNYLKATGYKLGLLINFGDPENLIWERIVN